MNDLDMGQEKEALETSIYNHFLIDVILASGVMRLIINQPNEKDEIHEVSLRMKGK